MEGGRGGGGETEKERVHEREAEQRGDEGSGEGEGARGSRVYGVSFTRWPSPFIANLLNETCRAYIVRLLVPSVAYSPPIRSRLETRLSTPPTVEDGIMDIYIYMFYHCPPLF